MKRILSMILVCVLIVGMLFTLASCGKKLSGTYEDETGMLSYTFKGKKVTMKMELFGAEVEYEGTYKIKGDEMTMTFEIDGEEESETFEFEKGKDYIELEGVKFTKK